MVCLLAPMMMILMMMLSMMMMMELMKVLHHNVPLPPHPVSVISQVEAPPISFRLQPTIMMLSKMLMIIMILITVLVLP